MLRAVSQYSSYVVGWGRGGRGGEALGKLTFKKCSFCRVYDLETFCMHEVGHALSDCQDK